MLVCQEHISDEEVSHSEYYQDFLIASGGRYQGGWVLANNIKCQISLAFHRRKERFERQDLAPWESVAQHARHAVSLSAALAPSLARGELLRQAIDSREMVCIMVDSNGRLLDSSAAAIALLQSGNILRLRLDSQLATLSSEETTRLHNLIANAATGRMGGVMRLAGHWLVQVVPSGVAQQNPFDPRFANCALIFVTPPKPPCTPDWRRIQVALDCTRAEAEVAAELVSGMSPSEIAARRNASLNTVRTQIRILLAGTGFHRIAELVSFLATVR
jgi:DNA-binding CsgD family transcriptional regulator